MTNTCVFHTYQWGFIRPLLTTKVLTKLYLKDEKLDPYFFFQEERWWGGGGVGGTYNRYLSGFLVCRFSQLLVTHYRGVTRNLSLISRTLKCNM